MTEKDVMGRAMLNITKMMGNMFELFPTRGEMIYHCINMPWRKSNWQGLKTFWGNTKKRQRELQRSIEDQEHKLWARELALQTRAAQRQKQIGEAWGQVMRTALGFDLSGDGHCAVVKATMLDDGTVYHEVIHEGRLPSVDWRDATPRTSSAYTFNEDAAQLAITAVPKICDGDPHIEGCSDHG